MRWFKLACVVLCVVLCACQSVQEKDALLVQDRISKLESLARFKPVRCELRTRLSAPQAVKYRTAFPDETKLVDDWNVTMDWTARRAHCEVHAKPLTPVVANQRTFVESALCTLLEVFWAHSPFDELRLRPEDMIDQEDKVFLRQKPNSDIGVYLAKKDMTVETHIHAGIYSARYEQVGGTWLPTTMQHRTASYQFLVKDLAWDESAPHSPPKSFWIYVGDETDQAPAAHTQVTVENCKSI